MWNTEDWISEYLNSSHFFFLEDAFKPSAEGLLNQWCQLMHQHNPSFPLQTQAAHIRHVCMEQWIPSIADPTLRANAPLLLLEFAEFIAEQRFPEARQWQSALEDCKKLALSRVREDGSVRGQTQVNKGSKLERNELCFCGSGKKFKKCCGPGLQL